MKHLKFELIVIDYPLWKEAHDKGKRINILTTGQDILKDNTDFDCSKNPDVFKRKGIPSFASEERMKLNAQLK